MFETDQKQEITGAPILESAPSDQLPKKDTRFQKGQSGNPAGRPKRTPEEQDALDAIKALAPRAVDLLSSIVDQESRFPPALRLRAAEIILERTYGKPEAPVKVTSVSQTVEQSREYILSLVESVRETTDVE